MNNKEKFEYIVTKIKEVADSLGIHPSELTQAIFFKHVDDITPWELRKMGGLGGVIKAHFPMVEKDLVVIREQKEVTKYVTTLEKKLSEQDLFKKLALEAVTEGIRRLNLAPVEIAPVKDPDEGKRSMTVELMLSDIHFGKKSKTFNLEVCRKRLQELTAVTLREIKDHKKLFNVDRLIIALLGDIIESYTMHGFESSLSSEFGNAKQVQSSIESLFNDVLVPLGKTGLKIDIPCVTGNHDRYDSHRTMNDPGLNNLTWIIYNSLKLLCEASGFKNMTFYIPTESYVVLPIYKNYCIYEHGDNVKAPNKMAFDRIISARSQQTGKVLDFARFGHWHEYACYDRGKIIVNESVCGQDSYAQVLGYNSTAGQTINYYIETDERPTCFYKSFPVYLK